MDDLPGPSGVDEALADYLEGGVCQVHEAVELVAGLIDQMGRTVPGFVRERHGLCPEAMMELGGLLLLLKFEAAGIELDGMPRFADALDDWGARIGAGELGYGERRAGSAFFYRVIEAWQQQGVTLAPVDLGVDVILEAGPLTDDVIDRLAGLLLDLSNRTREV